MKVQTSNVTKPLPSRVCQNCEFSYLGNHCPNCGQRYLSGRFTIKESIGWIFDKLFNLEKGFFFTIKELILNTHVMLMRYFNKATVDYMHPFRFVFLLATLTSIAVIVSGTFESKEMVDGFKGYIEGWNNYEGKKHSEMTMEAVLHFIETVKKYFAFILMINIPLYSISTWIMYRSKKLNFAEHLILNCYAYGFTLLIGLPLYAVMFLENGMILYSVGSVVLFFGAYIFFFKKLFQETIVKTLFKVIGITILTGVFSTVFAVIAGFVYAIIKSVS